MPSFNLTPGAWVQIVAPGGAKDQQVQVTHGRALICFGIPDATTASIAASTAQNKIQNVPAGVEVQARATGGQAIITTGDF